MKCLRCGKEIVNTICDSCGYDNSKKESLETVYEEVDNREELFIISYKLPVCTLIFGFLSFFSSIIIALYGKPIVVLHIVMYVVFFITSIILYIYGRKSKYRLLREIGIAFSFISILIAGYCMITWVLEIMNII